MVQDLLKTAVFQFDQAWENPSANLEKLDEMLFGFADFMDLIVLPEMFTTGFTMNVAEMTESMDGDTLVWMKSRSREYNVALIGTLIIAEHDNFYNRLVFVQPSGEVQSYNKRHLFTMGLENDSFTKGAERVIVTYKGWRICPLICYDLRFPVWSRNRNEYDLLVYPANWPDARQEVWDTLLKARAIENQVYVVGVNRIGTDGNSIRYSGGSQIIGPKGNVVAQAVDYAEHAVVAELSYQELLKFRTSFPVLNDADSFRLEF